MSSDTSYCPALRGSCGGGYEGGVHLFTPEKAGAKRSKTGVGWGDKEAARGGGHKAREEEKRWMAKRGNIVSKRVRKRTQQHNTESC